MPPQRRVDLDLDALAPPHRTVKLHGRVLELPGDMPIETVLGLMRLQDTVETADEAESQAALQKMLDAIHGLFRECDPDYEPVPLTLSNVLNILGLVLSGMNIDFEAAIKEALDGGEEGAAEEAADGVPPTAPLRVVKPGAASRTRSRKPSPARS